MQSRINAALRNLDVIERCMATLHDLAAESPAAARVVIDALQARGTPAAWGAARQVRHVAEARHGDFAMRDQ